MTSDWHFKVMFSCVKDEPRRKASLAGNGMAIDTNPSLGDLSIRDMSVELERAGVCSNKAPVFVANHYRAIADIAAS